MKRIFHYLNIAIFFILFVAKLQAQTCIVITHPDDLTITTTNTDASCNGASSGKIVANASGGTTPYEYSIDAVNFAPSNTFPNLAAGAYSISVKDANGCTKAIAVTLTEPGGLSGTISSSESSCTVDDNKVLKGANASFIVTATGGTTPYAYNWSDGLGTAAAANATVTATNNYNVTITDNKGCIFIPSKTVTVIDAPSVAIAATETSCTNNDDKVLPNANVDFKATASGGLATYTYAWDNSLGTADIANTSVSATTIYNVTATDTNGCTATAAKTITVLPGLALTKVITQPSCNAANGSLSGAIDITLSGVSGTPTFIWSNTKTTEDLDNLGTGTYIVSVTDANGCMVTDSTNIVEPALLNAGVGTNPAPICSGNSLVPIVLNDLLTGENAGGTWTLESGTPNSTTAFDNTANTFAIKGTSVGVYVFKYQMGTAACGDSENISITIQDCCPAKICLPVKVTKK